MNLDRAMAITGPILLFDGLCVLCSRSVQFVLAHERDTTIRFVALQSEEGHALASAHGIDPSQPNSFLFVEDGVAYAKSAGVLALVGHLRLPWRFARGLTILPRAMLDRGYDWLATNRYRLFGKRDVCMMPTPDLRARFGTPPDTV